MTRIRPAEILLLPILALLLIPSSWQPLGLVAGGLWLLFRWARRRNPAPETPFNLALLILLAATAVALIRSPVPSAAAVIASQLVAGTLALFYFVDHLDTAEDLWRGAALVTLLALAVAVVSPFLVKWSPDKLFSLPVLYEHLRLNSPVEANSNVLAGVLAPALPLTLALFWRRILAWRVLGAAGVVVLSAGVLLLQSRGALFGLGVGLAVWATLYRRWLLPFFILVVLGALVANSITGGPSLAQVLYGSATGTGDSSYAQRQELWVQGLYLLRLSPVTGIGMGAYSQVAAVAWPHSPASPGPDFPHVHNLFLQVALDTGIIGGAAFIVLFLIALRIVWRSYRQGRERDLAIALLAAISVIIAQGLGDTVVWASKSSLLLWILLGLSVGFDKKRVGM